MRSNTASWKNKQGPQFYLLPLPIRVLLLFPITTVQGYDYSNYNSEWKQNDTFGQEEQAEQAGQQEEKETVQLIYAGGATCSSSSSAEQLELLDLKMGCVVGENMAPNYEYNYYSTEDEGASFNVTYDTWCTVGDGEYLTFTASCKYCTTCTYRLTMSYELWDDLLCSVFDMYTPTHSQSFVVQNFF